MEEHTNGISNLENAYITSRYIPSEFKRKEVENMLNLAKKLRSLLISYEFDGCCQGNCSGREKVL